MCRGFCARENSSIRGGTLLLLLDNNNVIFFTNFWPRVGLFQIIAYTPMVEEIHISLSCRSTIQGACNNTHGSSTNISFQICHHNHPCTWPAWISLISCNRVVFCIAAAAASYYQNMCRSTQHSWLYGFSDCILIIFCMCMERASMCVIYSL